MEISLTPEQRKRAFEEINSKSDRMVKFALLAYFAFSVFMGFYYDSLSLAVVVGGLCLAIYFSLKMFLPTLSLNQYAGSVLFAVFTGLFIYQSHGKPEMFLFPFISATVLISYQNWKLQLPHFVLIIIHHSVVAYMQNQGATWAFFNSAELTGWMGFILHVGLITGFSILCMYWAAGYGANTIKTALAAINMEMQMSSVSNNIAFANEISKGNLSVDYKLLDESDELGRALLAMRKNLLEAAQREQEEKFITVGITKVGDIIRQNSDNVKKLADEFIVGIVKYLGINQGGLFLHDDEGSEEYLELIACYAYERKKFLNKRVRLGEGLTGQCFLEKEQIYMTKVPDEYTHITSGLGGATPGSILLMPLMTNEAIVGVMELASFKPFSHAQIEFIKTASENIAASIVSSRTTERVKKLLQESQQQAEEMKAQEEEMRQNMEELQATQEEMARKNAEVEKLLEDSKVSGSHE